MSMEFFISFKDITYALLTIIIILSETKCDNNESGIDENKSKYTNVPFSTPEDLIIEDKKDLLQKLIRLLTDAEFRKERNKALETVSPPDTSRIDELIPDVDDLIPDFPRIHIHHIFPPALIRPLQRLIIRKIMSHINSNPIRKMKRRLKAKAVEGAVAVGVGIGIAELADMTSELKNHNPTARYHVTGLVDLSAKKPKRSSDYDSDYETPKTPKDYNLVFDKKNVWPFHESKDVIYEKWNKFPHETHPDHLHQQVKYIHKSFHEMHPELLHLVHDIHGLFAKKKDHIITNGHELESPLVVFGHLFKLLDSLIPSIRIRIPFIEHLINSFHKKTQPKVVYVKQPPKVQYIPVPYKGDPTYTYDTRQHETPLKYKIQSSNPNVQYVNQYPNQELISHKNYEIIGKDQLYQPESPQPAVFRPGPNYDSRPPPQRHHSYTTIFENEAQLYKDKKKAAKA